MADVVRKTCKAATLIGVVTVVSLSCRSKLVANAERTAVAPNAPVAEPPSTEKIEDVAQAPSAPEPTPQSSTSNTQDLVPSHRTHYQTRSTVHLMLPPDVAAVTVPMTLESDTTGDALFTDVKLSSRGAMDGVVIGSTSISLIPSHPELNPKLAYGTNRLRLLSDNPGVEVTFAEFTIRDFPIFSLETMHFAVARGLHGGLAGSVVPLSASVKAKDGSVLNMGFVSTISR